MILSTQWQLLCRDCDETFTAPVRNGPRPSRCPSCALAHRRKKGREYAAAHRRPLKEVTCVDCGLALPKKEGRGGRNRLRCDECLAKWTRVDGRKRDRRAAQDPVTRERRRASGRISYAKNAEKIRERKLDEHYRRKYGITREQRDQMLAEQNGLCKICRKPPHPGHRGGRLHVDHCHKTNRVRGLLCGHCNTMIGLSGENPEVLIAAAEYLLADVDILGAIGGAGYDRQDNAKRGALCQ